MSNVFITGSSDGLGLMVGQLLAGLGHSVVLHARNEARAEKARAALPESKAIVLGDVSTLAAMRDVAEQANGHGRFDAVVHNVGVYGDHRRTETIDGLSGMWAVNVLAPYVLTALIGRPDRLVYLSSGMHLGGDPSLRDLQWRERRYNGMQAYSDSKLHDVLLAFGIARRWPGVAANAVDPGWVATRMGGPNASDDLDQAHRTQAWLAVSDEPEARTSGGYYYHLRPSDLHPGARETKLQDRLIELCREASGIALP